MHGNYYFEDFKSNPKKVLVFQKLYSSVYYLKTGCLKGRRSMRWTPFLSNAAQPPSLNRFTDLNNKCLPNDARDRKYVPVSITV